MNAPTRRGVLAALAGAGFTAACKPEAVLPDGPVRREADAPWGGVRAPTGAVVGGAAGDPGPDTLIVVGRQVSGDVVRLGLAWWDGAGWVEGEPILAEAVEGYLYVEVGDLPADAPIAWQWLVDDDGASDVGHARTTPAPDVDRPVRVAVSCCSYQGHGDFPSLAKALSRGQVDAYVTLGDTVYADAFTTLEGYRTLWNDVLDQPAYAALRATTAVLATWDDHEVDNGFEPTVTPEDRVVIGRQAMYEHLPIRRRDDHRLWRSFRFGRAVELFLLDARGERDPTTERFISDEQLEWLIDGVTASDATFKLVLTSVPITAFPGAFGIPLARNDTWDGDFYRAQRAALLDALDGVPGVLFVTGDHHFPGLARVDAEGPHARRWEVLTGPLGSDRPPVHVLLDRGEQFPWFAQVWCATLLDLHPSGWARITVVGEDDETWFEGWLDVDGNLLAFEETPDPAADGSA